MAGPLHRSADLLARALLRRLARRPPGRGRCSSRVERVSQAGHGLFALWRPLWGAPGDRGAGKNEVLHLSLR